ncbi:MAG: zinc-finger domain-containing protein [Gammaproteobacteria bacterium]|nr:zinc-finger domain-containing protein [Gammaproteobacteria bacterium]
MAHAAPNKANETPATAPSRRSVTAKDLPLHCPTPDMSAWDSHPRVFLPIQETGEARCPYCGTLYTLKQIK